MEYTKIQSVEVNYMHAKNCTFSTLSKRCQVFKVSVDLFQVTYT